MISSRISQKIDTTENWNSQPNFVPLKGEIVVYDDRANSGLQKIKIGDGVSKVGNLDFINGLNFTEVNDNSNYKLLFHKNNLGETLVEANSNSNITINPATNTISTNISGNAGGLSVTLPVTSGGTGKTTFTAGNFLVGNGTNTLQEVAPTEVLSMIGANKITASTTDLTAGVSPLAEGEVYLVYE